MNLRNPDIEHVRCCSCEKTAWKDSIITTPIIVPLNYKATWERPTLGNILAGGHQAVAWICQSCYFENRPIQYAVEFQPDVPGLPGKNIVYHPITSLEGF